MGSSATVSASAPFTLLLFDAVDLRGPSPGCERVVVNGKAIALLAYLSLPRGRFVRRDTLTALLWPESDTVQARTSLRKTLHVIRRELTEDIIIARGEEELAVNVNLLSCDATTFIAAADAGFLLPALEMYRGDLMPGFHLPDCVEFDRWLEMQRLETRERAAASAWALAQRLEADDSPSDAAGFARKAVRFSWNDERALRRALSMLDRLGDRAGALKLFDEFARRIADDLDAEPSPETQALVARLRNGQRT